jgi:hypothetical protein
VRVAVLHPMVTGVDGGGGLRWSKQMVVKAFVHVGGGPTHANFGLISSELVGRRYAMIFIYLCIKNVL